MEQLKFFASAAVFIGVVAVLSHWIILYLLFLKG